MNGDWKHEAKQESIKEMIDWIVKFMLDNGYPPTYHEIAKGLMKDKSTINAWINEAKGLKMLDTVGSGRGRAIVVPGIYYVDDRSQE